MQKTLARFAGAAGQPVMMGPAGEPISLMVRAGPTAKAPEFRCLHFGKSPAEQAFPQSASAVQGTAGFANVWPNAWPQNPQKTKAWALWSTDVLLDVPVVSA